MSAHSHEAPKGIDLSMPIFLALLRKAAAVAASSHRHLGYSVDDWLRQIKIRNERTVAAAAAHVKI